MSPKSALRKLNVAPAQFCAPHSTARTVRPPLRAVLSIVMVLPYNAYGAETWIEFMYRVMPPSYTNVYCDAAHEPRFEHSIVKAFPGFEIVRICCAQPDGQFAVSVHGKSHTNDNGVVLGPAGAGMIIPIDGAGVCVCTGWSRWMAAEACCLPQMVGSFSGDIVGMVGPVPGYGKIGSPGDGKIGVSGAEAPDISGLIFTSHALWHVTTTPGDGSIVQGPLHPTVTVF